MFDKTVYHGIRLSAARCAQYDGRTERVYYVDISVVPLLPVIEACGQVHRILVLDEPRFLHEALVLHVEHVFHEVGAQKATHPCAGHQQADIARRNGGGVQCRVCLYGQRQGQYPPVQKKQHQPCCKHRPNPCPRDFFLLDPLRAQTRECQQHQRKKFRIKNGAEQSCGAVEVQQYPVHHADVDAPQPYGFVTIPIEVYDHQ